MANNDDFIQIEWDGLAELEEMFKEMGAAIDEIAMQEYTKYGLLVEEGAKALAFKDRGELEQSINFDRARKEGNLIVVQGGTNLKSALRLHESPYKPGVRSKYDSGALFERYYNNGRGEKTRAKSAWRGYQPGRKFLSNAVLATETEFDETNDRILKRVLEGERG